MLSESEFYCSDWVRYNGKLNPTVLGRGLLERFNQIHHFKVTTDDLSIWKFNSNGYYEPTGERFLCGEIEKILQLDYNLPIKNTTIQWIKDNPDLQIDRCEFDSQIELINLKNGVYNIETKEFTEHKSEYLLTNQIPVIYNPDVKIDKIKQFLEEVLYKDDIPVIQELIGYLLYKSYPIHKAFIFDGSGANGKSTLLNLLTTFIGKDNIVSISLQQLAEDRFIRAILHGKLANIYADLPDRGLKETGTFKILTGEDYINASIKLQQDTIRFKNYAKLIFSCNKIPIARDDTSAYYRRWKIVSFPNTFMGDNCKPDIIKELTTEEELSGLFNWVIEGLERLLEQGEFSNYRTLEDIRHEYERKSNPIIAFVEDCIEESEGNEITKEELYNSYTRYCKNRNIPVKANNIFSRELRSVLEIEVGQKHGGTRYWKGIRLR